MNEKTEKYIRKFVRHIRRTLRNKLYAIALIMVGIILRFISNDITFLVFTLLIGIPMFFSNKNWIYK